MTLCFFCFLPFFFLLQHQNAGKTYQKKSHERVPKARPQRYALPCQTEKSKVYNVTITEKKVYRKGRGESR